MTAGGLVRDKVQKRNVLQPFSRTRVCLCPFSALRQVNKCPSLHTKLRIFVCFYTRSDGFIAEDGTSSARFRVQGDNGACLARRLYISHKHIVYLHVCPKT